MATTLERERGFADRGRGQNEFFGQVIRFSNARIFKIKGVDSLTGRVLRGTITLSEQSSTGVMNNEGTTSKAARPVRRRKHECPAIAEQFGTFVSERDVEEAVASEQFTKI